MKDTKYNGWTNWETWNWKLWMDNDEFTPTFPLTDDAYKLSKKLSDYADDMLDIIIDSDSNTFGFFADACNMAIREVNFFEIAEHLIEERENDS